MLKSVARMKWERPFLNRSFSKLEKPFIVQHSRLFSSQTCHCRVKPCGCLSILNRPLMSSVLSNLQSRKNSRHFSDKIAPGALGLQQLLQQNRLWAREMKEKDPEFFNVLSKEQTPEVLWIGCSDSRVPANQIMKLEPGNVFVHRNIANQVVHSDLNVLSVLEFAVNVLKVKHIVVCGHYGCGGIRAALTKQPYGLVDNWLLHIKDIYKEHYDNFKYLSPVAQADLLAELNVARQVHNVCYTSIVQTAWENGHDLSVHGWCYRLSDGIIRDLKICMTGQDQVKPMYRLMCQKTTAET